MEEQVVKFGDILKNTLNKWKIIIGAAVILATVAAIVNMTADKSISYNGSVKVLVRNESLVLSNGVQVKKDDKVIPNYIEVIKSSSFINTALKDNDVNLKPETVIPKIKVTNITNSDFINIQYSSNKKEQTFSVLKAITNHFKDITSAENIETQYGTETDIIITEEANLQSNKKIIVLAVFGGLVLTTGVIFILECIKRKFRTSSEVENVLKVKPIGIIPAIKHGKDKRNQFIVEEAYNTIASNIKHSATRNEKAILVTSSVVGEGSTTTALGVAKALARSNGKVLLIDANFRNSSIGKLYSLNENEGLVDVVKNKVELKNAVKKSDDNLDVLGTGNCKENTISILDSEGMDKAIDEAKAMYDYVIVDAPPVKVVADSIILSTKVDGTILLVGAEKATYDTVKDVVDTIKNVNGNIIGVVFNSANSYLNKFYNYK